MIMRPLQRSTFTEALEISPAKLARAMSQRKFSSVLSDNHVDSASFAHEAVTRDEGTEHAVGACERVLG